MVPLRQEEGNKFDDMKSLILKTESEKKELQSRIKLQEIEVENLNDSLKSLGKKKEKLEAERDSQKQDRLLDVATKE